MYNERYAIFLFLYTSSTSLSYFLHVPYRVLRYRKKNATNFTWLCKTLYSLDQSRLLKNTWILATPSIAKFKCINMHVVIL
jgi:hypothetical protein